MQQWPIISKKLRKWNNICTHLWCAHVQIVHFDNIRVSPNRIWHLYSLIFSTCVSVCESEDWDSALMMNLMLTLEILLTAQLQYPAVSLRLLSRCCPGFFFRIYLKINCIKNQLKFNWNRQFCRNLIISPVFITVMTRFFNFPM